MSPHPLLLCLTALVLGCAVPEIFVRPTMTHRMPGQLGRVVQVESFLHEFKGTDAERDRHLNELIGYDVNNALDKSWQGLFYHCLAQKGNIQTRGSISLSFLVEPHSETRKSDSFAVEGWGIFDAATTQAVDLLQCVQGDDRLRYAIRETIKEEALLWASTYGGARHLGAADIGKDNAKMLKERHEYALRAIREVGGYDDKTLVETFGNYMTKVLPRGQTTVPPNTLLASGRFVIDFSNVGSIADLMKYEDPILEVKATVFATRRFAVEYLPALRPTGLIYCIQLKSGASSERGVFSIGYAPSAHNVLLAPRQPGEKPESIGTIQFTDARPGWKLVDLRDLYILKEYEMGTRRPTPTSAEASTSACAKTTP